VSAPSLKLAFDINTKALVSFQGAPSALPDLRQTRYSTVRVYVVESAPSTVSLPGGSIGAFQTIDYSEFDSLRMGLFEDSNFVDDNDTEGVLAFTDELGWALVTDENGYECFEGSFNVNTNEVKTWGDVAQSKAAYFCVNLTVSGELVTLFDQRSGTNCTVYAATDKFTAVTVSVTSGTPTLTLPLELFNPVTGNRWAIQEVTPGVLQFVLQ
jgi:hypothetical protein